MNNSNIGSSVALGTEQHTWVPVLRSTIGSSEYSIESQGWTLLYRPISTIVFIPLVRGNRDE